MSSRLRRCFQLILLGLLSLGTARAEDGYRLWLRYDRITDQPRRAACTAALGRIVLATPAGADSPTIAAARDELLTGLAGLLGSKPAITIERSAPNAACGDEGYAIGTVARGNVSTVVIAANRDIGVLYGAFAFLRHVQTGRPVDRSRP